MRLLDAREMIDNPLLEPLRAIEKDIARRKKVKCIIMDHIECVRFYRLRHHVRNTVNDKRLHVQTRHMRDVAYCAGEGENQRECRGGGD